MARYLKIYFTGIFLLFICACSKNVKQEINKNSFSYRSPVGYMIDVPNSFKYSEYAPSKDYYYFGYPKSNQLGISTIELYKSQDSCSPSLTGASKLKPVNSAGTSIQWGTVDVLKLIKEQDGYWPPYPVDHMKCGGSNYGYALCAEKDEKTVLICINQKTDNPTQAEDIFKTFRWTD